MSYQTASSLCYFGTTNPKIREAITALLAGEHAIACELLATSFMDTKEELDREQVAAAYAAEENDRQIAVLREQRDEAIADAKHQRAAAEAMAAAMAARAEVAEEQLEAAHEENRTLSSKNYSLSTQLDENEEELLDVKEQLSAANSYIQELTSEMWDLYAERADLNKQLKESRGRKPIWGGGVVPLYDDEDEDDSETAPETPISVRYECPQASAESEELFYPPLELAANGCLVGCDLCAAKEADEAEDGIDRSELEDDMEMVAACYADGQRFCPEKPLSFADVLRKTMAS
jgi:hypothetical protein